MTTWHHDDRTDATGTVAVVGDKGRRWWQRWPGFGGSMAAAAMRRVPDESSPLLASMIGSPVRHGPSTPAPVDVDWRRWAGTWYEAARLPVPYENACATSSTPRATYTPRPNSTAIDVANECDDRQVRAVAHPVGVGRLWVDFGRGPKPPPDERALGNYVVLYVDPAYTQAVVATPDLQSAWALSRYPGPEPDVVARLVERMHRLGVDTARLVVNRPAVPPAARTTPR
ncbi:Lipocalin domain containing protein [Pandoravirus dulcis]|uniref:Lipocalin domain containing protein n=1 Tax=Pandoravirus dulcis TaxID=1349409 RepID=A0A291AU71_9VIRU|nr:Lipocalin domain containing protein [Pandoravirus dulcis]ATE82571.1 Lipocalin domain containing protein [Pandoravirus dulcis]